MRRKTDLQRGHPRVGGVVEVQNGGTATCTDTGKASGLLTQLTWILLSRTLFQHPPHFREALGDVHHVAQPVAHSHRVKRGIIKGQRQSVALHPPAAEAGGLQMTAF